MVNKILPSISTPRLTLELVNVDQAPLAMEARIESFLQLKEWDIFTPELSAETINLANEIKMFEWRMDRVKRRESLFYSIFRREDGRYLGNVSLTKCDWKKKEAMIGFWVRTLETGKGYATEAARYLLNYGRVDLGLNIYSMHAKGNQNSRAVLLRLGFQPVPEEPPGHLPTGPMADDVYYEVKCHNDGRSGSGPSS